MESPSQHSVTLLALEMIGRDGFFRNSRPFATFVRRSDWLAAAATPAQEPAVGQHACEQVANHMRQRSQAREEG